jgi:subtilisin family serine protease
MSKKAILIFDPNRRPEQLEFVAARAEILHESGDQAWVEIEDAQAERFAEQGILVQFYEDANWIETPAVYFDPQLAEPQPPATLAAQSPTGDVSAYTIVQFIAQPDPDWINQIENAGGVYIQDQPIHAAIFRLDATQMATVRSFSFVRWIGLYHPAYALSFALAGRSEPFDAVGFAALQIDSSPIVPSEQGNVEVLFFDDQSVDERQAAITAAGASVRANTGYSLIIDIDAAQLPNLLRVTGVSVVERYLPADVDNFRAGVISQVVQVRRFRNVTFLTNLDGAGEFVGVFDSGLDTGVPATIHPDLAGRTALIANINGAPNTAADGQPNPSGPAGAINHHGTHVVGTIAGDGAQSAGRVRGVAPAAQVIFHSANDAASPNGLTFNRFLAAFAAAHARGARVHSNSWGSNSNNLQYDNATSGMIDRFCYLNPEDLVIFTSGNSEQDANGNGTLDQNSMRRQSLAKNVLGIGATENITNAEGISVNYRTRFPARYNAVAFNALAAPPAVAGVFTMSDNADHVALFSNRGRVFLPSPVGGPPVPAARRRVKPDLVAPGTNIVSTKLRTLAAFPVGDVRRANSVSSVDYFVISGTSMAAPHVAGAALLTRQYYRRLFGQLRRPLLLEPIAQAVDFPAIAPHANGAVMAWVRRDGGAGQNHIVAARFDRTLARQGNIVQLTPNVGAQPAPMLVRRGDDIYLLHRGSDNQLRLSRYDLNLQPVNGFGTNGVVTIATASRNEENRRPALCVRENEVAVVWHQTATDNLIMQRFAADTGAAIDANPATVGTANETSSHACVLHNGTRYALLWMQQDGGAFKIRLRFVNNNGAPVGAQPRIVFQQGSALNAPHFVWDPRYDHFMVVWVDGRTAPAGELYSVRVDANGGAIGAPQRVVTVTATAGASVRRPLVAIHPTVGYVLLWEDNSTMGESDAVPPTQVPRFDLYMTFLDTPGAADGRIPSNRLSISDTDKDTLGFACLVDGSAITPIWQSNDEINSALIGVYTLNMTFGGRFQVQVDPTIPLIDSGSYIRHRLLEHNQTTMVGVAMTWTGADFYLLRVVPDGIVAAIELVRTNADGLPVAAFGNSGARRIDTDIGYNRLALHWANTQLVAASGMGASLKLFLFDLRANAAPVNTFGANGRRDMVEPIAATVATQVSHIGAGANFRVVAAWGRFGNPNHTLRYAVLNRQGNFTVAPRDLVADVTGTALHGWFHFVESDTPARSIAAWHQTDGAGNTHIFTNRFNENGLRHNNRPNIQIDSALAGDSLNAVIAPRPVTFAPANTGASAAEINQSRRREYAVAWQFRPNAAAPWEIRFSRLSRDGTFNFPAPPPVPPPARDVQTIADPAKHCTDPQLVWHADGYGLAWLSQPVAGGNHILLFTVLDQQGTRLDLNFGVGAVNPAPIHQISADDADVQDFELVWNGRTFRITWTETRTEEEFVFTGELFQLLPGPPKVRHMQMAIAVPRKPGPPGYDRSYEHPSSALVRATLINGATNIRRTTLPNHSNDPNDGYGWGRLNLRQSLAPLPPVTFYARDDGSVASGHTVTYRFRLPPETRLLRATLSWTDPPDVRLVNNLSLRITSPDARIFVGNRWQAAPNAQFSDPLPVPAPVDPFESVHNTEQIVLPGTPTLPPGEYIVEVIGGPFRNNAFQTHPGQPFALVFVGSGAEARFAGLPAPATIPVY